MANLYVIYGKLKFILEDDLASGVTSSTSFRVRFVDSDTGAARTVSSGVIIPVVFDPKNTKDKGSEFGLMTVGATASGITTITSCVRGIDPDGAYAVTGSTSLSKQWESGTEGGVCTTFINDNRIRAIVDGVLETGATNIKVGLGTDVDIYFYAYNADANKPYVGYDATTSQWVVSHNGVDEVVITGAGGTFAATKPLTITAGNIALDYATNPGLETSSDAIRVKTKTAVAGYLTGGAAATSVVATWTAVADGSFAISIDGVAANITSVDFTSGVTTMADVATKIQTKLQAVATGGFTAATCAWSTDHFVITSGTAGNGSSVSVTSAVGSGTDISGVGATTFMDAETGVGTATAGVGGGITRDTNGLSLTMSDSYSFSGKVNIADLFVNGTQVTATAAELNKLDNAGAGVTAANLSTLTTGATTDGGALHKHLTLNGAATRTAAAGAGDQTIAHGLGRAPNVVIIFASTTAGGNRWSNGSSKGATGNQCIYFDGTNMNVNDTTNIIFITDGTNSMRANVSAVDATNITLTWTKANSGIDTYLQWIAF